MIEFLKESTFAVNDVVNKSWEILYRYYRNIAGLCLSMFTVLWMSGFLSSFVQKGVSSINILIIIVFILAYLGLQLTLFRYVLYKISVHEDDTETFTDKFKTFVSENALKLAVVIFVPLSFIFVMSFLSQLLQLDSLVFQIITVAIALAFIIIVFWNKIKPFLLTVKRFWPKMNQLGNLLLASVFALIAALLPFLIMAILFLPLIYIHVPIKNASGMALTAGAVIAFIVVIRISFFPFFIIDMDASAFKSIRFSMAVTRGNFTRLLFLLGLLAFFLIVAGYLQTMGYYFLSLVTSLIYSFIIIPLSSVATAVAYRQMMNEYEGDADPDIIHNLI